MTFMIQTFVLRYNLLSYPISYEKNYPHPYSNGSMKMKKYTYSNGSMKMKKYTKMFPNLTKRS